jgi:thiamine pyrophosphokinase
MSTTSATPSHSGASRSAVVITGGDSLHDDQVGDIAANAIIIVADAGIHHALDKGLRIDVVVGDLDSAHPDALATARRHGAEIVELPTDKDLTDTEAALLHAASLDIDSICVVTGGGGRLDHQLGVLANLFHDDLASLHVEARWARSRAWPLRAGRVLDVACSIDDTIGLVPFGGDALGVHTEGLRWALTNESLRAASSRGVSNRAVAPRIRVTLGSGRLLVINEGRVDS